MYSIKFEQTKNSQINNVDFNSLKFGENKADHM